MVKVRYSQTMTVYPNAGDGRIKSVYRSGGMIVTAENRSSVEKTGLSATVWTKNSYMDETGIEKGSLWLEADEWRPQPWQGL